MYYGTREPFQYYSCVACDTLQIVDILEGEELMRHYPSDYCTYKVPAKSRVARWMTNQHDRFMLHTGGRLVGALIAAFVSENIAPYVIGDAVNAVRMLSQLRLAPDARILDVGCGGGALLDRLASVGFKNLYGVDPFIAADTETAHGVPLMKRYLGEMSDEFDLIMFNHSLEHVPDPVATLQAAREKLAAHGVCLVRLPTPSSEAWATYRENWVGIDPPRHIVIPSRQGMAVAADRVGLRVEKTIDDSAGFQFMASEAYRRDVALTDPAIRKTFGWKELWNWEKRAERLNREGRGDQAGFFLRAK
ncbi:methyltransferase [Mycobacterium sp. E188]|nr:methyltransferase [Mycobacterium sp. E188]OBH35886.1 methyltransferase [Mycobacterium sp. E183]